VLAVFVLALVSASACLEAKAPAPRIRVACVGDSITEGDGVEDPAERYPARLGALLGDRYEVRNFGASGSTMLDDGDKPYRRQRAYRKALDFRPDVVVIALGTNDSKPWNWSRSEGFSTDVKTLVEAFRSANAGVRVFLCRPVPVVGGGNFGIRGDVVKGEITSRIDRAGQELGVEVIDLHGALEGRLELIPDRVHPNGEGARLIADAVYRALTKTRPAG
jgi:lysophospholipase L1-like esterase